MKAYKFLRDNMKSGYGREEAWQVREKRVKKGELELCVRGYHSSPSWYDALSFAKGSMACIVEVSKPVQQQGDKQVSHECTIINYRNAEKILRSWACDCAERALKKANVKDEKSWDAIKVARLYNEGKATKEELAAARDAAEEATWEAAGAAARAAGEAARAAAWDAGAAAWDAAREAAAWAAVWAAARAAVWAAAWDAGAAVRDAEIKWQKKHLDKLMSGLFT